MASLPDFLRLAGRRLLLGALLLFTLGARAQQPAPAAAPLPTTDVILDLQGNELTGQVLEVTPTQVVYRPAGTDVALPPTVLDKRTLFMVRFANGSKETFAAPVTAPAPTVGLTGTPLPTSGLLFNASTGQPLSQQELLQRGQQDALRLHNYKGVFWGTFAGTVIYFYPGLVIGGVCALTRPIAARNLLLPMELLQQPSYVHGYETQAQRRKLGKAAAGFGAGMGALTVIAIVIVAAFLNSGP